MSGQVIAMVKKDDTEKASNGLSRKEKKAIKEAAERQRILDEAAKISRAYTHEDRLIIAKADGIKLENELVELEAKQARILGHLGEHNREDGEDDFATSFAASFREHEYKCPVLDCGVANESVKWVLPLISSVRRGLDAKGRTDDPRPKNHRMLWQLGVELFAKPKDLQSMVFCESCRPRIERNLEIKYPQEDERNYVLYHVDGFSLQLGRNRFRLLRQDLMDVEGGILDCLEKIEQAKGYIESLEKAIAKEKAQERSILELI